MQRSRNSH